MLGFFFHETILFSNWVASAIILGEIHGTIFFGQWNFMLWCFETCSPVYLKFFYPHIKVSGILIFIIYGTSPFEWERFHAAARWLHCLVVQWLFNFVNFRYFQFSMIAVPGPHFHFVKYIGHRKQHFLLQTYSECVKEVLRRPWNYHVWWLIIFLRVWR